MREIEMEVIYVIFLLLFFYFLGQGLLYSPRCPRTHYVEQSGIQLRDPPTSASRIL